MQCDDLESGMLNQLQPCKIVILGPPCSGKRTVQKILTKKYGFLRMKLPKLPQQQQVPSYKSKSRSNQSSFLRKVKGSYYYVEGEDMSQQQHTKSVQIDMSKHGGVTDLCYKSYHERGVFIMQKPNFKALKHLKQRNFINVVCVDAPFAHRYKNACRKQAKLDQKIGLSGCEEITMQEFAQIDEAYQNEEYLECLEYSRVKIINNGSMQQLQQRIKLREASVIRRFRPNWDQYFMKLADIARRRSNCMKSSVGAVIVNQQNRVVSTGYNGTPKGLLSCFRGGCKRCNNNQSKGLDTCLCLHAEQSAIIQVGISNTVGCRLYTTLYPCFSCAKVIKQAGIKKIYYMDAYDKEDSGMRFLIENYADEDVKLIKINNLYY